MIGGCQGALRVASVIGGSQGKGPREDLGVTFLARSSFLVSSRSSGPALSWAANRSTFETATDLGARMGA